MTRGQAPFASLVPASTIVKGRCRSHVTICRMAGSTPQRQRLEQIDVLRARAGKLTYRHVYESIGYEVREVCNDLDMAVELLGMDGAGQRLHTVLPMADAVIKNTAVRLATLEKALKIDQEVRSSKSVV
jgi:hypothetical protein